MSNAIGWTAMKTVLAGLARAFAQPSRTVRVCREIWLTAVTPSRRTGRAAQDPAQLEKGTVQWLTHVFDYWGWRWRLGH